MGKRMPRSGRHSRRCKNRREIENEESRQISDLAFDVNAAKGFCFCALKVRLGLSGQKVVLRVALFKELLAILVDKELVGVAIAVETEFLRDETELHIWLITVGKGAALASFETILWYWGMGEGTHALHMLHNAARRSRPTNMSMRYAPILMLDGSM